jgi:hypothetical protein
MWDVQAQVAGKFQDKVEAPTAINLRWSWLLTAASSAAFSVLRLLNAALRPWAAEIPPCSCLAVGLVAKNGRIKTAVGWGEQRS